MSKGKLGGLLGFWEWFEYGEFGTTPFYILNFLIIIFNTIRQMPYIFYYGLGLFIFNCFFRYCR